MDKDPKDEVREGEPSPIEESDPNDSTPSAIDEGDNSGLRTPGDEGQPQSGTVDLVIKQAKELADLTKSLMEENRQLRENMAEQVRREVEGVRTQMEEMRDKLPKVVKDDKATITGYYDYDSRAREYIHAAAKKGLAKARAEFRLLGA